MVIDSNCLINKNILPAGYGAISHIGRQGYLRVLGCEKA